MPRTITGMRVRDIRMPNSRFLDGMTTTDAKEEVARRLETEIRGNAPVGLV